MRTVRGWYYNPKPWPSRHPIFMLLMNLTAFICWGATWAIRSLRGDLVAAVIAEVGLVVAVFGLFVWVPEVFCSKEGE